eukprot:gb/GEZN01004061.1/.p1 GENE.gb/GEZN01004061.1/~~gb/GEZN01004061.1/.p1  ORF type:complete len:644 (+),score=182.05 gb/GEZN01004061.1/:91-1932(+)
MEDVDNIIIPILAQMGCQLAEKKSIAAFESDDVYHAAVVCLKAINPEHEYSLRLPPGKAPRFRLTSNLSNEIKDMGYDKEMGYQTFLYPSEHESRKLLIWLVDKLPKSEKEEDEQEALGADAQLAADIMARLRAWGKMEWHPLLQVSDSAVQRPVQTVPLCLPRNTPKQPHAHKYYSSVQPLVSLQPGRAELVPLSLLELNQTQLATAKELEADWGEEQKQSLADRESALAGLLAGAFRAALEQADLSAQHTGHTGPMHCGAFRRRTDFEQEKSQTGAQVVTSTGAVQSVTDAGDLVDDETEDAIREAREKELSALQEQLKQQLDQVARLGEEVERNLSATRHFEAELAALKDETKKLEATYKLKRDTLALLPNAEANLKSLAKLGADKSNALLNLNKEWETVRVALVNKYRKKKQLLEERKADVGRKVAQIKRMRVEMKQKAEQVRKRDRTYKQVAEELRKLPKSVNRQVYVRRIMDIVKNLDKQKAEIKKILSDVRRVQRDINQLEKTSSRSFAMADQVVYQQAEANRDDPVLTQAFKNVVTMREGFTALVEKVEETGKLKAEYSDLTQQIEAFEARNQDLNTSKLEKDLEAVKSENASLLKKLQQQKGAL